MRERSQIDRDLWRSAIQELLLALEEERSIATVLEMSAAGRGFRARSSCPRYITETVAGGCTIFWLIRPQGGDRRRGSTQRPSER